MKTKCAKNTEQMVRRGNWKTTRGGATGEMSTVQINIKNCIDKDKG